MTATATEIVLVKAPVGDIKPSEEFTSKSIPLPTASDLKDGQILYETLYISLDPIMRYWIRGTGSYKYQSVKPGQTMAGLTLGRVTASRADNIKPGDYGTSWTGWVSHAIVDADKFDKKTILEGTKLTDYAGVLSFTGLTAYYGMERIGKPKAGDTVVVSTAAGAVGSIAAQLAKNIGARVVGITGSDEKVKWLKEELGLDEALNYKDPDYEKKFAEAVKTGIDVYFDNVGGRTLELVLDHINAKARIGICGDASAYNSTKPSTISNYFNLAIHDSTMQGVNVFDYMPDQDKAWAQLASWIQEGKIKRTDTVIKSKIEDVPKGLLELFAGKNTGKMLVEIKDPEA